MNILTHDDFHGPFIANLPTPIAITDADLRYILCSRGWKDFHSLLHDVPKETTFNDTIGNFDVERLKPLLNGTIASLNYHFMQPESSNVHYEFRLWHRPDGSIGGFILNAMAVDTPLPKYTETESSLRENRFIDIFHNHNSIMMLIDPKSGTIVDVNKVALDFYGYAYDKIVGLPISVINQTPEEALSRMRCEAAAGERNIFVFTHRLHSGELKSVEVHSSPIQTAKGPLLFSIIKDITLEEENKRRLNRALEQLQLAKQIARLGIWEYDLTTGQLMWSDEVYSIVEHDPKTFQPSYETFLAMVHPDDRPKIVSAYAKSLENKTPFHLTHRVLLGDGRIKYVQERCKTFYDDDGHPVNSIGTIYDITHIQELSDAMQKEKERYRSLMQYSSDGIIIFDMHGNVIESNDIQSRMLGYTNDEMKHLAIRDWDIQYSEAEIAQIMENIAQGPVNLETVHRRKDGTTYIAAINSVKVQIGNDSYIYSSTRDITDEKRLEHEIIRERNFISAIIDSASAVIAIIEADGTMSLLNRYGQEFTGYTQEEVSSIPYFWNRFLHPSMRDKVEGIITKARHGEIIRSFQNSWISKQGEERMFEWSNALIAHDDGSMHYVCTIGIDISDKINAQQTILKQKEEFETIFKSSKDGLAILDLQSNFLEFNDAYMEMTGFNREELLQKSCIGLSIPEDVERAKEAMNVVLEKGFLTNFEKSCYRKDGAVITINMAIALMPDKQHLLVSAKNVTRDKQMREEIIASKSVSERLLREQESLLSLFDKGDSVLFKWNNDMDWSVGYVSGSVERLMEYTKEEFFNGSITYAECIHPDDLERVFEEIQKARISNADFFKHPPYRIITKSGRIKWVLDYTVTQKDASGAITHFVGYFSDITDEQERQKEIIEARKSAENANRAKSEFLANMSHEIRTPLNGIMGLIGLTMQTRLNSIQNDYLSKAYNSSTALLDIINDILDYSKIEAGKLSIEHVPFALDQMLYELLDLFIFKADEKKIALITSIDPRVRNLLIGDPFRIRQVLVNLIGNALKFTSHGRVDVTVSPLQRENSTTLLRFSVKDTGIGIPAAKQSLIFGAFNQVDASNTRVFGGTGLGLAISRRLVELMGGSISFESEEGTGSEFYFTVPFEYNRQDNILATEKLDDKTVLIFSPSVSEGDTFRQIFESLNIESKSVHTIEEAVQTATARHYDFILLDLSTKEDFTVLDSAAQFKTVYDAARLIVVCQYTKRFKLEEKAAQNKLQLDYVLYKPFSASTLVDALASDTKHLHQINVPKTDFYVKGKVLLAEDNDINMLVAKQNLEHFGLDVIAVANGELAVQKLRSEPFDIVLMDIQMPVMDGYEATRQIRRFNRDIPIIALSAAVMQHDKDRSRESGMNAHIAKPINLEELKTTLSQYLNMEHSSSNEPTQQPEKSEDKALQIEGVDVEKLLDMADGDQSFVIHLLKRFADNQQELFENLEQDVESEAFEKFMHNLKGTSGTLALTKVYEFARSIYENRSKEFRITHLPELKLRLSEVIKAIETATSPILSDKKEETAVRPLSAEELHRYLFEWVEKLGRGYFMGPDLIDELIQNLSSRFASERLNPLKESLVRFDYMSARTYLENLLKEIV